MNLLPIQGYIRATLGGYAPLAALIGTRIYDRVANGVEFPYVVISTAQAVLDERANQCVEDWEVISTIDVWSRAVGFSEAKRVGAEVMSALSERNPTISGIVCGWFGPRNQLWLTDPDGLTSHGVLEFTTRCRPEIST